MKSIRCDEEKNRVLRKERGVTFDEVLAHIENEDVLAVIENPSREHPHQKAIVLVIKEYVYYVPFVADADGIFLKTIIPSLKLNRKYNSEDT